MYYVRTLAISIRNRIVRDWRSFICELTSCRMANNYPQGYVIAFWTLGWTEKTRKQHHRYTSFLTWSDSSKYRVFQSDFGIFRSDTKKRTFFQHLHQWHEYKSLVWGLNWAFDSTVVRWNEISLSLWPLIRIKINSGSALCWWNIISFVLLLFNK